MISVLRRCQTLDFGYLGFLLIYVFHIDYVHLLNLVCIFHQSTFFVYLIICVALLFF